MGVIDNVKERLDIVEVVSQYVALTPSGKNFKARCPFHSEKTPSFFVFPDRQSWRCFGACAEGGDSFSFVKKAEKLTFGDTLKILAQKVGVSLPEAKAIGNYDALLQANEEAATYYSKQLTTSQGAKALAHLEGRGVNAEAIATFRLGYSPASGDALKRHLLSLGLKESLLLDAGLVRTSEDGPSRDLFRGRLMIPIFSKQGRVVGFGARALDDSQPKYLNSPKTPIFDKGSILYGLHIAADHIRREDLGVIVEGYMDVIGVHQYGFRNVVASMGTALTNQQVVLLKNITKKFVLALDQDAAGQNATLRSLESSWKVFELPSTALELRIASLPEGKDPDEVTKESPEEWKRVISGAVSWQEFYFSFMLSKYNLNITEDKVRASEEVTGFIRKIQNPYLRYQYFKRLADVLGIPVATLEASAGTALGQHRRQSTAISRSALEKGDKDLLEEHTLTLLITRPELREVAKGLKTDYFHRSENKEVFTTWLNCPKLEGLQEILEPSLKAHLEYLFTKLIPPSDRSKAEEDARQCMKRLEDRYIKELKLQEEALLTGEEPDEELKDQILAHNDRLRQIHNQDTPAKLRRNR